MTCSDVDMLVHPYLDGELVAEERVLVERHVVGCPHCRELVGHETTFREHLRARLRLRPQAQHEVVAAPALRRRVLDALDRADKAGEGPALPWAKTLKMWFAPALGALATAAAIVVFFSSGPNAGRISGLAGTPLVEEAIAGHMKNLPPEVRGTDDEIRSWMRGKVAIPVRPPFIHAIQLSSSPRLVGARLSHLASRDAGQIFYWVGASQMTVYVFDPSGWEFSAPARRVIDGRVVYVAERAGYTVALYRDRGIGYAVATDLDEATLLRLLEASLRE